MSKRKYLFSVVIATLNSEKNLRSTLESVVSQKFESEKIEILVVDGGSTDKTVQIAKEYNCKVIINPKVFPVHAKYLGFIKAKGDYVLFIDSDEVLVEQTSFQRRLNIFKEFKLVKAIMSSGYRSPEKSTFSCKYINEFGDPFSKFIYNSSKDERFFMNQMKRFYTTIIDNDKVVVFDFSRTVDLPIIELIAMASMVDKAYFKKLIGLHDLPELIPHLFYILQKNGKYLAVMKNDAVVHYSSEGMKQYLKKIRSRVISNTYTDANEGFLGRSRYFSKWTKYKKLFFIPFAITVFLPFVESMYLVKTRSDIRYILHLPLTILTSLMIIYYSLLKLLGIKPSYSGYGK